MFAALQAMAKLTKVKRSGANPYGYVQRIVNKRSNKDGSVEFLIRWRGYSKEYDSWEPYDKIEECAKEIVEEYESAGGSKGRKRKKDETENGRQHKEKSVSVPGSARKRKAPDSEPRRRSYRFLDEKKEVNYADKFKRKRRSQVESADQNGAPMVGDEEGVESAHSQSGSMNEPIKGPGDREEKAVSSSTIGDHSTVKESQKSRIAEDENDESSENEEDDEDDDSSSGQISDIETSFEDRQLRPGREDQPDPPSNISSPTKEVPIRTESPKKSDHFIDDEQETSSRSEEPPPDPTHKTVFAVPTPSPVKTLPEPPKAPPSPVKEVVNESVKADEPEPSTKSITPMEKQLPASDAASSSKVEETRTASVPPSTASLTITKDSETCDSSSKITKEPSPCTEESPSPSPTFNDAPSLQAENEPMGMPPSPEEEETPFIQPLLDPGPPFDWPAYLEKEKALAAPPECFWKQDQKTRNLFLGCKNRYLSGPDPCGAYESQTRCVAQIVDLYGPWVCLWLLDSDKDRRVWYLGDDSRLRYLDEGDIYDIRKVVPPTNRQSNRMSYVKMIEKKVFPDGKDLRAPKSCFDQLPDDNRPVTNNFQVGQKLESYDPVNGDGKIYPCTVVHIHKKNVKIHFDGYPRGEKEYPFDERCLLPCGFAAEVGIPCVLPEQKVPATRARRSAAMAAVAADTPSSTASPPFRPPSSASSAAATEAELEAMKRKIKDTWNEHTETPPSKQYIKNDRTTVDRKPPVKMTPVGPASRTVVPTESYMPQMTTIRLRHPLADHTVDLYVNHSCNSGPNIRNEALQLFPNVFTGSHLLVWQRVLEKLVDAAFVPAFVVSQIPKSSIRSQHAFTIVYDDEETNETVCQFVNIPRDGTEMWMMVSKLLSRIGMCTAALQYKTPKPCNRSCKRIEPVRVQDNHQTYKIPKLIPIPTEKKLMRPDDPSEDPRRLFAKGVNPRTFTIHEVQEVLAFLKIPKEQMEKFLKEKIDGRAFPNLTVEVCEKMFGLTQEYAQRIVDYNKRMKAFLGMK